MKKSSVDTDQVCSENIFLDVYANRSDYDKSLEISSLNSVEFATKYKVVNKKLTKQPDNVIPRVFPSYSSNPKGPNFPLYCKYQLLRYKPWKISQDNAWDNLEPANENFIQKWHVFLETGYAHKNVPGWFDKLQEVIKSQQDIDETGDLENNANVQEGWMVLCDLHKPFHNSHQGSQLEYDWHQDRSHYTEQQIGEMPSWVTITTTILFTPRFSYTFFFLSKRYY